MNEFDRCLNILTSVDILNSLKDGQSIITEMFVHGKRDDVSFIISYRKDIYLFQEENHKEVISTILEDLFELVPSFKKKFQTIDNFFEYIDEYSVVDMFDVLKRNIRDILCGIIENDVIYLFGDSIKHNPYSSELVMKITKQLNLSGWEYPDSFSNDGFLFINKENIKASIPDIGYHATSSKYLSSILINGLRYDQSETNWKNIEQNSNHRRTIFFSTNTITSLFHSNNAIRINKTYPIIIEFQIPNKEYIVQDFDIERSTGETSIHKLRYSIPKKHIDYKSAITYKPNRLSQELGIYGYAGNIYPKYIKAIWIPNNLNKMSYEKKDFVRLDKLEAKQRFNIV